MSDKNDKNEPQEVTPDATKKRKTRKPLVEVLDLRPGVTIENGDGHDRWFHKL
jgi:hypothetical protein